MIAHMPPMVRALFLTPTPPHHVTPQPNTLHQYPHHPPHQHPHHPPPAPGLLRAEAGSSVAAGNSMGRDDLALDAALNEFGDLCRRTRRVMQAAQAALLPPELLPEFSR